MTNMVRNQVTIMGEEAVLKNIVKECFESETDTGYPELDFERIIPIPVIKDLMEQRRWCIENWSVGASAQYPDEEDIYLTVFEDEESKYSILEFGFETTWSMPHKIYEAIVNKYPVSLEVSYLEDMHGFAGVAQYRKGHFTDRVVTDNDVEEMTKFLKEEWCLDPKDGEVVWMNPLLTMD